jgi:hypothetical protein
VDVVERPVLQTYIFLQVFIISLCRRTTQRPTRKKERFASTVWLPLQLNTGQYAQKSNLSNFSPPNSQIKLWFEPSSKINYTALVMQNGKQKKKKNIVM